MTSNFYVTGGTLRHDAPSYVERQADKDLLDGLLAGEFCYVLTSRQMGKSSLMVRTANRLRDQGIAVVVLDLTSIGQNVTPDQWYDGLLVRMGRQLNLAAKLDTYWETHPNIGPCQRFFEAIHDVVLAGSQPPQQKFVIFLDEIDTVRSLPFSTDEFFAGIRECYNRRAEDQQFNRLAFCLLGVAMPSDLVRDSRLTPFNIGRRIELNDFTVEEASVLARGLESPDSGAKEENSLHHQSPARRHARQLLQRAFHWTNGHPYLTQRLCGTVLEQKTAGIPDPERFIDHLCEELFFSTRARERDDNLIFVREHLLRSEVDRTSLFSLYDKVIRGHRVPDDETNPLIGVLRLTGIVRVTSAGLVGRNRIYTRVFDRTWVSANLPNAEIQRQRAAFRRGVIRTTAIAAVIVAALLVMFLIATNQAAKARYALGRSYLSQAGAARASGVGGQRYDSLKALREAHRYHTDDALIRDEVIASLALPDIKANANQIFSTLRVANVSELNPNLQLLATAQTNGQITLTHLKEPRLSTSLPGLGLPVRQMRWSPSRPSAKQQFLLAEYADGSRKQIVVWDCQKREKLLELPFGIHANAVDFSPDGRKLAVGQNSGRVTIYSLPEAKPAGELRLKWESGLPRSPQVLRFNPSADLLAESCLDDSNVQIWDLNTKRKILRFYHPGKVFDLSWHPHGELLAAACGDACIYLWDTNHADRPIKKLIGHENGVKAIAFNNLGNLLASAGVDETLRLWIPATERQISRRLDADTIERLQFSSDDSSLLSSDRQSRARLWDVASAPEYISLQLRTSPIDKLKSIDFSPDGKWLAAASGERSMIWDCPSGRELATLGLVQAHAASFSSLDRHLIASTDRGWFEYPLREATNGNYPHLEPSSRRLAPFDELGAMALSRDRTTAALVHHDEILVVSVAATNANVSTNSVRYHYDRLGLHPEALWVAGIVRNSNSIHLWNLSQKTAPKDPVPIPGSQYFTFSPDGKWFAACAGGHFQFYRVDAWEKPAFSVPRLPSSDQHAPIAFTPDSALMALAASRYTIQLLKLTGDNPPRHRLIATLESPDRSSPLEQLAFSPNGRHLAAATVNLTVHLWNLSLIGETLAELNLDQDWPQSQNLPNDAAFTSSLGQESYVLNPAPDHEN